MKAETLKWLFLGTGGGRFVVFRGIRRAGGYCIEYNKKRLHIDPGPCALSSLLSKKIYPSKIHGIYLSHIDLDHSAGLNVIAEGITEGGFKKRGIVFLPSDALKDSAPILLPYLREYLEKIEVLKPLTEYNFYGLSFTTSPLHKHRDVQCLGFKIEKFSLGFISDTGFDKKVFDFYKDINNIVLHLVLFEAKQGVDHLSYKEIEKIIDILKGCKKLIITHFGMELLKAKPKQLCEKLSKKFNIEVLPAYDGMEVNFYST